MSALLISLIDLTSLNEADNEATITALCQKTITPFGKVAAVCVYPQFVQLAAHILQGTGVQIATVINFPEGTDTQTEVERMMETAISNGATEIDLVFPYKQYLSGDKVGALNLITQIKAKLGSTLLKVILETGQLPESLIAAISHDIIQSGADFLKTSTGKTQPGATLSAASIILETIKTINPSIGFKASGGIRSIEEATQYVNLAKQILGSDWVTQRTFRLGTSQLLDNILLALS